MTSLSPHQLSLPQPSILQYGTPRRSALNSNTQANPSSSQDDLSSSDKENSPAKAYFSRNSDNMTSEMTGGSLSFTPRRVKNLPRAWERRPATPYVPRNEGQKIWKRIPLGELASGHSNIQESRRNKESKEDYVRAVKKMRMDDVESGDVIENGFVFVGTKWEEENIEKGRSPKKKALDRHISVDHNRVDMKSNNGQEDGLEGNKGLSLEHTASVDSNGDGTRNSLDERGITVSSIIGEQELLDSRHVLHDENNIIPNSTSDVTDLSDYGSSTANLELENITASATKPEITEEVNVSVVNEQGIEGILHEISKCSADLESGNDQDILAREEMRNTGPGTKPVDEISTISESSVASDLEQSHVSLINSSSEKRTTEDQESEPPTQSEASSNQPSQSGSMPVSTRSMKTFVGTDSDETAFLHDFLLRARASKVARSVTPTDLDMESLKVADQSSEDQVDEQNPLQHDDIEDSESITEPHQSKVEEDTTETTISSPVRRSSRTANLANTKLPRPQTLSLVPQFGPVLPSQNVALPNTIQLKRATGTEFIFNAKLQQTLAMTTRANTKRNQGNSVNVMTRLAQLKSTIVNVEADEQKTSLPTLISVDISSPAKNNSNKRKHVKNDETKLKKSVRWNEEIASYLDPTPATPESKPTCNDFAKIEANAQAEALMSLTNSFTFPKPISDSTDNMTEADPTKRSESMQETQTDEDASESSKHKVRKLRRVNIGSVNGTPAPKTRSQSSRLTPHSTNASSSGIPKLGSRMPIPTTKATQTSKQQPTIKDQDKEDKRLAARRSLRARN